MGCLRATFKRAGGLSPSFQKKGGRPIFTAKLASMYSPGSFDLSFDSSFSFLAEISLSFDSSFDLSFTSSAFGYVFSFKRVRPIIKFKAARQGGMTVSMGRVCRTGIRNFIKVDAEWVFLMPENDYHHDTLVYSNVEWIVS